MSVLRVLATYGHPDDEGQATGTLARLIERGARVTLVCATRGEVGEISHPKLATPETLPYVRELELRAAMAQIGLDDVRFLPYRDSGMAGTVENEDPRSLHAQPPDVVVGDLVGVIREVRPHVVFTWEPGGGYGHPDHVAVHRHTLDAFDAAGDAARYAERGGAWQPRELYWGAFTMRRFASIFLELEQRGLLPEPLDEERRRRFATAMTEPEPDVSLVHDVSDLIEPKRRSAAMHRTQFGENSVFARIPLDLQGSFFGEERFYRARPAVDRGGPIALGIEGLLGLAGD